MPNVCRGAALNWPKLAGSRSLAVPRALLAKPQLRGATVLLAMWRILSGLTLDCQMRRPLRPGLARCVSKEE